MIIRIILLLYYLFAYLLMCAILFLLQLVEKQYKVEQYQLVSMHSSIRQCNQFLSSRDKYNLVASIQLKERRAPQLRDERQRLEMSLSNLEQALKDESEREEVLHARKAEREKQLPELQDRLIAARAEASRQKAAHAKFVRALLERKIYYEKAEGANGTRE